MNMFSIWFLSQQEGPNSELSKCFCLYTYGVDPDGDGPYGYVTGSNGIIYQVIFYSFYSDKGNRLSFAKKNFK